MGQATVRARVRELSAKEVYRRLADFPEYPRLCDAVREVVVLEADEQHMVSAWEVNFHRGILRWTERAEFCPDEGLIRFAEVEGDVDDFRGHWSIQADEAESTVEVIFDVVFTVGIPTLEHILDPIAEEALHDNVTSILTGLMGELVTVEPLPPEADRPRAVVTDSWS